MVEKSFYALFRNTAPRGGSILCHVGDPRSEKPETLREYGILRERMIQKPWACLSEQQFVHSVTKLGCPFYGALLNGRDLPELQFEKLCWRMQTIVGLDFDDCPLSEREMSWVFEDLGIKPWLSYFTFSNGDSPGVQSYRLLWRVEPDLNLKYEECAAALKTLRALSKGLADKHASNPTRLWQGTTSGFAQYNPRAQPLNLKSLLTLIGHG